MKHPITHYAPRAVAGERGRLRALCGARVPAEQITASIAAASCERCREVLSSPHRAGEIAEQLLAASSGDTGEAWRRLAAWIESGVLRGGPEPLRRLLAAVRGELDRRVEPAPLEPKPMKPTTIALLFIALSAPACDLPGPGPAPTTSTSGEASTSDGEPTGSTGDTSTGGTGYVCAEVGQPCDLDAPACGGGLDCVERPDLPGAGVCGQRCNLQIDGVTALPCKIGWCDIENGAAIGLCRDDDGLPTGLCDGVPSCAGDPCEGTCANGLSCIVGACAFACETAKDCAEGQACLAGACFAGDGLADPCN